MKPRPEPRRTPPTSTAHPQRRRSRDSRRSSFETAFHRSRRAALAPLRLPRELERELAVALDARGVDARVGDRLPDGAPGLGPVRAVPEPAARRDRGEVASNVASSPLASQSRSSRIPGPSASTPPPGSGKISPRSTAKRFIVRLGGLLARVAPGLWPPQFRVDRADPQDPDIAASG